MPIIIATILGIMFIALGVKTLLDASKKEAIEYQWHKFKVIKRRTIDTKQILQLFLAMKSSLQIRNPLWIWL